MAVDIGKCLDDLEEASDYLRAGQQLELDGIVDKNCKAVVAEIKKNPPKPPTPPE